MRARWISETVGGLAGVALVVVVFLPWWELDFATLAEGGGWTAYAPLAADASVWGVWPGRAFVLTGTGALAAGLLVIAQAQEPGRAQTAVRVAVVVAAAISLAIAVAALAAPPFDHNRAADVAYIATALIVTIAICAATGLRRA